MRIKVEFFVRKPRKRGGARFYWEPSAALRAAGWSPLRLADDERTAIAEAGARNEKLAAWRKGEEGDARPAARVRAGTLKALRRSYEQDRRFSELREKSRRGYRQNLDLLEAEFGDDPVQAIDAAALEKFYLLLRKRAPARAQAAIVMARILFAFAAARAKNDPLWCPDNPARAVKLSGLARAGKIWPTDAVDLFVEAAAKAGWPSLGTVVALNEWIGQREGDVLALPRSVYRDGLIVIRQSKTGAQVALPVAVVPKLVAAIEAEQARQRARKVEGAQALILCETTGQAWREDHFRHAFAAVRARAAGKMPTIVPPWDPDRPFPFAALKFMHFRHTAVTRLAEAGCPATQIRAITGHSLSTVEQILERYLVNTPALAAEAFKRRLAREGEAET